MHRMGFRIWDRPNGKLIANKLSCTGVALPRRGELPCHVRGQSACCYRFISAPVGNAPNMARRMLLHSPRRGGPPTSPQVQPALGHELAARKSTGLFRRRVTRQELAGPGLNFFAQNRHSGRGSSPRGTSPSFPDSIVSIHVSRSRPRPAPRRACPNVCLRRHTV